MNAVDRRRTFFKHCLATGLALSALPVARAASPTPAPPAEFFFENNAFGGAVLSPDGRCLAVRTSKQGSRDFLVVIDLESRTAKTVAAYTDADIGDFQWVNETRLAYDVRDRRTASGDRWLMPGVFAVNRDGTGQIQLAARHPREHAPQPWNTALMQQPGSQDSEWIYVECPTFDDEGEYSGTILRRLNTINGKAEKPLSPDFSFSEILLDAHGKPRLATVSNASMTSLHYLDPVKGEWRELARHGAYRDRRDEITPLAFGPDGTLYVAANAGEDFASLRTMDLVHGTVSAEPLVATPGYDFSGAVIQNGKVLGLHLTTDARGSVWFDPTMKRIQAAVDKALPKTNNLITVPTRAGARWLLVESYSDVQPARFLVYDTETGTLDPVGSTYPRIDAAAMGRQQPIRYKARDWLEIPGLLTLPPGVAAGKLPMVVLVHGGPWIRGSSWGWAPESQFLASRGYAVLEVEYRGSTGFGAKHFESGLKQWGLSMQNDIADGARWAIAQGIADPNRICIAGASYGGYAALMGLVNDPDLYRCGVDWAGVTDINLMYTGTWYAKPDTSEGYRQYGMPVLIGDPVKDADQLRATSPLEQSARIRQPILLAYGSQDHRVPVHQGKKFYEAVRKVNRQVEWVEYDGEGHGWSLPENRVDFWKRVERFLDRHIGPGSLGDRGSPVRQG